jgi:acyl-CoA thioesterase YciA
MPAIRVAMMPKDTNAHGTIFGGVIFLLIDQARAPSRPALSARRRS